MLLRGQGAELGPNATRFPLEQRTIPGEFGEHEMCVADVDLPELHAWLDARLPRFMVPRYLERRTAFPKTPSERIEKYKLANGSLDRPEVREFVPARR